MKNFVGQWLQARDVESVQMDPRSILAREDKFDPELDRRRRRFSELMSVPNEKLTPQERDELRAIQASFRPGRRTSLRADMTYDLRRAMRLESEKVFDYVIREDRSLLELIDSDYTFLNERLANHYGITNANVVGDELRRVTLPADSPAGA